VEHESAIDLHRAAGLHGHPAQRGVGERTSIFSKRRQRHVGRLDDDAEGTLRTVLAHVGQRMREMQVRHRRHGDRNGA
jgi:hypothetical protein